MAKMTKTRRQMVSPEEQERNDLATQVMQQMGLEQEAMINERKQYPSKHSTNASERVKLKQKAAYGENVDDAPTDGMIADYGNGVLDELGDAAYDMSSQELFNSLGWSMNPTALAALDKLDPEERIELIRATAGDPITDEDMEQMANETRARRPMSNVEEDEMDKVRTDVLNRVGVE